jgi:hypothetical protein
MTEVAVILPLYATEIKLPKVALLELFPESILAQTAQEFGDTFEITNPIVTPQALVLIQQILLTGDLPLQPPEDVYSMLAAFDYLNMPQLNVLTDPFYPLFRQTRPQLNLLQIKSQLVNPDVYRALLLDTVAGPGPILTQYIVENAPVDAKIQDITESLFVHAASIGNAEVVEVLLQWVNPVTAELNGDDLNIQDYRAYAEEHILNEKNQALNYACLFGYVDTIRVLLQSRLVVLDYTALARAWDSGSTLAFQLIALDPRIPAEAVNDMMHTSSLTPVQVRILLNSPKADPNLEDIYVYYVESIDDELRNRMNPPIDAIDKLNLLYWDPRTNLALMFERLFEKPIYLPSDLVLNWMTHPKFKPDILPKAWYQSMVYLWPLEVLAAFIQRFPETRLQIEAAQAPLDIEAHEPQNDPQDILRVLH